MPGPMSAPNGNAIITRDADARRKAGKTGKTEVQRAKGKGGK